MGRVAVPLQGGEQGEIEKNPGPFAAREFFELRSDLLWQMEQDALAARLRTTSESYTSAGACLTSSAPFVTDSLLPRFLSRSFSLRAFMSLRNMSPASVAQHRSLAR